VRILVPFRCRLARIFRVCERWRVQAIFYDLKGFRRVATRYGKLSGNHRSCVFIWL